MSGLDVNNFNLFAKKNAATGPSPKPIAKPANTHTVEEELKKFESEVEDNTAMNDIPVKLSGDNKSFNTEMKPNEDLKISSPVRKESKLIEVSLKAPEKSIHEAPLRKFETFATPTFRIPEQHDFELKKIENFIMRNRKKGINSSSRERITSNSVVRALIANFLERAGDMDLSNIDNEEMLRERMEKVFKQKYSKKI